MKKVGVAILGLGVVGSGTYNIIKEKHEYFQKTQGLDVTVEAVLEIDKKKALALGVDESVICSNINEVVSNPAVDIVCEVIGGTGVAKEFVIAALKSGKSVVTSNKELYCKHSHELESIAKKMNVGLYFEASCVGGVPVIKTFIDSMQANYVKSITGIINGTTNYILSKMADEGLSYETALKDAQKLGYAEANPTADVEGYDAAYKLSILSSLAFHKKIPLEKIYREGITKITKEDIAYGREFGYAVKLLGIGKNSEKGVEVRVHPAFIKNNHPLASVKDSFNAVHIVGDNVGDIMLYGRGAGSLPTGSAIVSDVIYAARRSENIYSSFENTKNASKDVKFINDFVSGYYVRLTAADKAGVLAKIAGIFAKYNVSITDMIQKSSGAESVPLIFFTHKTNEFSINKAIERIKNLSEVVKVESIIRVEN